MGRPDPYATCASAKVSNLNDLVRCRAITFPLSTIGVTTNTLVLKGPDFKKESTGGRTAVVGWNEAPFVIRFKGDRVVHKKQVNRSQLQRFKLRLHRAGYRLGCVRGVPQFL